MPSVVKGAEFDIVRLKRLMINKLEIMDVNSRLKGGMTKELVHGFFEMKYKEVMPDYKVEFNQELYESFLNYEPERSSNFLLGDFCQKKKRKLGSFKNYIIRTLYSTSRIYSFKFEGSPTITFQGLARLDDFKYTNWPTDQLDQINKDARRHGVKIESSEREEILRLGDKLAYTQGDMEPINKNMFMAKNTNLFFISLYLFDQILSPMEKCGTTMALDGESAFILNKLGVKIKLVTSLPTLMTVYLKKMVVIFHIKNQVSSHVTFPLKLKALKREYVIKKVRLLKL